MDSDKLQLPQSRSRLNTVNNGLSGRPMARPQGRETMTKPAKQGLISSFFGMFSPKAPEVTKKDKISEKAFNFIEALQKD